MTQQTEDKLSFLDNLAPSEDFGLNLFLGKLDESLTDEEFEKLKFYCAGKHGIGKSVLEKIKRPLDLFTKLKERGNLSNENLLTLQAMLWFLPRKDLQKDCADFAKSLGNALHFVVPKDEPENGYKYVKFHIEGKDIDTFRRPDLERLRNAVALTILFIPPEFVIVRGIEPAKSLIITLMVPADYVDHLKEINDEEKETLINISVNVIYIGEVKLSLSIEKAENSQMRRSAVEEETRKKLYLLKRRENELETLQLQNIDLHKRMAELKNTNVLYLYTIYEQAKRNEILFRKQLQLVELENPVSELKYLSALSFFRHALAKVRQERYNKDIISNLLDAHSLLITQRTRICIYKLRQDVAFVQYERDKLAYYNGLGKTDRIMSEREEYFMSVALTMLPTVNISCRVVITDECEKYVIAKLAGDISKDEVKKVLQNLKLSEKEKKFVGQSALKLIQLLLEKKKPKTGSFDYGTFLNENFASVLRRPDVIDKFHNYAQEYYAKEQQRQMKGKKSKLSNKTNRGRSDVSAHAPAEDSEAKLDKIINGMEKMEERLKRIEEKNVRSSDLFNSFSNDQELRNSLLAKLNWGSQFAPRLIRQP